MMSEKEVVMADFSVLIIICFEGLGETLRNLSEDNLPRTEA
jgi:hypothetical protein